MFKFLFILLFLTSSILSESFKVISITGTVVLNGEIIILKDDIISDCDYIILVERSRILLENTVGDKLDIRRTGIYSGARMKMKFKLNQFDIPKELSNSLLDELSVAEEFLYKNEIQKKLLQLSLLDEKKDFLKSPKNSWILNYDTVLFEWDEFNTRTSYNFNIIDLDGNVIFSKLTDYNRLEVPIKKLNLNKNECYFWSVESGNIISEESCIMLFENEDYKIIEAEVKILESSLNLMESTDNIILAKYYESHNIMYKAVHYYENSIILNPLIKEHLIMYYEYLKNKGVFKIPEYKF